MMSESQAKYLDAFAAWLRSLGDDAEALGELVSSDALPAAAGQALAGGLNYLFKSLDLIPDGIDDIGYLDDAFVLRIACEQAMREDVSRLAPEQLRVLNQLNEDAAVVREFLGADFGRLDAYVTGLRRVAARGRSVQDILHNANVQSLFLTDVRSLAHGYQAPNFSREEKNLIKLKAFFDAKLPK
jgi:uncharacterized membrane protein YkvA (DUF1232 family)